MKSHVNHHNCTLGQDALPQVVIHTLYKWISHCFAREWCQDFGIT